MGVGGWVGGGGGGGEEEGAGGVGGGGYRDFDDHGSFILPLRTHAPNSGGDWTGPSPSQNIAPALHLCAGLYCEHWHALPERGWQYLPRLWKLRPTLPPDRPAPRADGHSHEYHASAALAGNHFLIRIHDVARQRHPARSGLVHRCALAGKTGRYVAYLDEVIAQSVDVKLRRKTTDPTTRACRTSAASDHPTRNVRTCVNLSMKPSIQPNARTHIVTREGSKTLKRDHERNPSAHQQTGQPTSTPGSQCTAPTLASTSVHSEGKAPGTPCRGQQSP